MARFLPDTPGVNGGLTGGGAGGTSFALTSAESVLTPTFEGQVVNPNGGVVSGLTVTVYADRPSANTVLGTATTASDGTWTYTHGSALSATLEYNFHARVNLATRSAVVTQTFSGGINAAPVFTSQPVISGSNIIGQTLTVTPGTVTGSPTPTVTRQWRRGNAPVAGATGLTYVLTDDDNNTAITCQETATNSGGTAVGTSNALTPAFEIDYMIKNIADKAKHQDAFATQKVVFDWSGNIVRLQRTSDNAVQDFGSDFTGRLNKPAIDAWRNGSSVNITHKLSQMGTGKILPVVGGAQPFILANGNYVMTTGTNKSAVDGTLSMDVSKGAPAFQTTGTAYLELVNSGFTTTDGIEITVMSVDTLRYTAGGADPAALSGDNTRRIAFGYGSGTTNQFSFEHNQGAIDRMVFTTNGISTHQPAPSNSIIKNKRFEQRIKTMGFHPTMTTAGDVGSGSGRIYSYQRNSFITYDPALQAGGAANVSSLATLNNATLRVSQGLTTRATNQCGVVAVIISKTLTKFDRWVLHQRLAAMGQPHRVATVAKLMSYFDEIIDFRDANSSTGLVAGRKGKTSIQFNQGAGNTFAYNQADPNTGVPGLFSPDGINANNTFSATNSYFANARECSLGFMGRSGTYGNIMYWFSIYDAEDSRPVIALGRHHSDPNLQVCISPSLDPDDLSGRYGVDGSEGNGDAIGGISQSMAKYAYNLSLKQWNEGSTLVNNTTGTGFTFRSEWGGQTFVNGSTFTAANLTTATGTVAPTPELKNSTLSENMGYPLVNANRFEHLIATIKPNPAYDYSANYATRKLTMKTCKQTLYACSPGTPLGQIDSDTGLTNNRNHPHGTGTERIKSSAYQAGGNFAQGYMYLMWFANRELTPEEVEIINLNTYRLYTDGYPV
jgi:hypothetical protein